MESLLQILASLAVTAATAGYVARSIRIVNEGREVLVERFGQYHRTLTAGMNFIVPILDQITFEQSVIERLLDVPPQEVITKDNVGITVDAVIYWRIVDLEKARYGVENVHMAIEKLILSAIREAISKRTLDQTLSSRKEISNAIIGEAAKITGDWGVEVLRVEIEDISASDRIMQAMEVQMASEREKRAEILRSEGEKQAVINKAEGDAEKTVIQAKADKRIQIIQTQSLTESMEMIADALTKNENARLAMQYLIAQNYIEMGKTIGESESAKVLFMDPNSIPGALQSLLSMVEQPKYQIPKQPFGAVNNLPIKMANPAPLPELKDQIKTVTPPSEEKATTPSSSPEQKVTAPSSEEKATTSSPEQKVANPPSEQKAANPSSSSEQKAANPPFQS